LFVVAETKQTNDSNAEITIITSLSIYY